MSKIIDTDPPHIDSPQCWCNPYLFFVSPGGCEVWVHNSSSGELPPAKILAQAVINAWRSDFEDCTDGGNPDP